MIDPDIRTLVDVPRVQGERRPDAPALEFEGRVTTYGELSRRAYASARALRSLGVRPGERVAWLAKNSDLFFDAFFGAALAGACLAPINTRLAPPEIGAILADSGARVLIVGPELVESALKACERLTSPIRILTVRERRAGLDRFETLRDLEDTAPFAFDPPPDTDVLQLYTSGTTGLPKGVQLTHDNFAFLLEISPTVEGFDYGTGDVVLNVMPLFHVAGTNIAFVGLAHGCRVVVLADFVPDEVVRLIAQRGVHHTFLAPAMIQMVLAAPAAADADLSSVRSLAYGASPISEAVLRAAQARFRSAGLMQFYGMTETTGCGTVLTPAGHVGERLRSCGRGWSGMEVKICGPGGPDGPEAAPFEVGEIAVRGRGVMKGYWGRPDATASALRGGWMMTGDAGYRDADGFVYVHDRVKDMIVTGGENVYPAEVENAIQGCPGVADVAVIGVPSERWGEEVKALVVARPGEPPPDPAAVIAWARERIAGYKAPKSVEVVAALPRNPSGKILRRELRAPYWEGRERLVG